MADTHHSEGSAHEWYLSSFIEKKLFWGKIDNLWKYSDVLPFPKLPAVEQRQASGGVADEAVHDIS